MKFQALFDYLKNHYSFETSSDSLKTSNSFARSDTGVVIDSEPHLICTSDLHVQIKPLVCRAHTDCSAFHFYTNTIT